MSSSCPSPPSSTSLPRLHALNHQFLVWDQASLDALYELRVVGHSINASVKQQFSIPADVAADASNGSEPESRSSPTATLLDGNRSHTGLDPDTRKRKRSNARHHQQRSTLPQVVLPEYAAILCANKQIILVDAATASNALASTDSNAHSTEAVRGQQLHTRALLQHDAATYNDKLKLAELRRLEVSAKASASVEKAPPTTGVPVQHNQVSATLTVDNAYEQAVLRCQAAGINPSLLDSTSLGIARALQLPATHHSHLQQTTYLTSDVDLMPVDVAENLPARQQQLLNMHCVASPAHIAVVNALHQQQFWLTTALNFGADYLVYEDAPSTIHATYICYVQDHTRTDADWPITGLDLLSVSRLASAVSKSVLVAHVHRSEPGENYDPAVQQSTDTADDWQQLRVEFQTVHWDARASAAK